MTTVGRLGYPLHMDTLPNGLRVIVSPDHAAPVVAVNLWYGVGSRDEVAGRTGLAHLFEHVMFQGSAHVPSGDHFNSLQAAGGTCNATTWFDRTNYFDTVPRGALDLALWLEADRMGHLLAALTQENLDNQRDVVKEEKRQRYDNAPYGDTIDHLLRLGFPAGHPYRHPVIGSMDDLDAASLADAHAFHERWYAPGNAVLTLVGDVKPKAGFRKAREYFGHLPARPVPEAVLPPPLPPHAGVPRAATSAPVPADTLFVQWRTPALGTRASDAVEIALDVLGGGETSRLYRRLVHDEVTCSTAGAAVLGLVRGSSLAYAYARALDGVSLESLEESVCAEVARLLEEGPTEVELERVRTQFERAWLEECARLASRADLFGGYASMFDDPDRVNRRIEEYCSLSATEVTEAARAWLRPEQRAVLEYRRGPLGEEQP